MDSSASSLMSLLAQKMAYLNQKQTVHAENVANASTPGYQAREITPFTFKDALKQASTGFYVTDARHIIPASMAGANSATVKVKSYDTSPDKNTVDTEQEAMKVSQTGIEYNLITSIFKKFNGLFRIAVKGS